MTRTTHVLTVQVTTDKPIPDMTDIFAGRIYVIDGVVDCTVTHETPKPDPHRDTLDSKIEEFNKLYALPWRSTPGFGSSSREEIQKRIKDFMSILSEEVMEGIDIRDMIADNATPLDVLTALADWLGDIQIYCMSEMKRYGLPNDLILTCIMASNMSKLGEDGIPIYDERGKVSKGPNYWKPEPQIRRALEASRRQSAQEQGNAQN